MNFLHKEMPGGIASEMIRDNNLKMPLYQNVEVNGKVVTMEKMGSIAYIQDRSEAIQAYYDKKSWTVGYINIKFELNCYYTYHGYIKCKTERVQHSPLIGGGNGNLMVDYKCPSGYVYFGVTCVDFKDISTTFEKANQQCIDDGILYVPTNQTQNSIFRLGMLEKVIFHACIIVCLSFL